MRNSLNTSAATLGVSIFQQMCKPIPILRMHNDRQTCPCFFGFFRLPTAPIFTSTFGGALPDLLLYSFTSIANRFFKIIDGKCRVPIQNLVHFCSKILYLYLSTHSFHLANKLG